MKIIGSLLLCFYLFLPLLIFHSTSAQPPQSQQQEGFVSLRCCAPSNITDPDTKLRWISDLGLFQNKGKCQNISMAVVNDSSYNHARLFGNNLGNKWCYNLTTTKGLDYLIRETFLHGLILRATSETIFDISIDATTIGTVNSSVDSTEIETVFRAPNDHINICLVRRKGNAYMSMLELRPLNQHSNLSETSIFNVVKRMDVGNTVDIIRYPYDPNDRIWNVSGGLSGNAATSISNFDMVVEGANATVPLQVLQTAIYDPERLELLLDDLEDGDNKYLVYLYFLELNSSVTFRQRVFDIYTNGVLEFKDFSITQQGNGTTTNYREIALNVTANQVLNVSLIRVSNTGLELGPICNAYEVFQVQNWIVGTRQKDVDAIVGFRDQLVAVNPKNEVLGGWSGDPCLPLPWQGLLCESSRDGSSVITQMDLSFNDLRGSLPSIITELIHLKNMNLSYNRLTGTIPSFPRASALTSIDLRHNDLLGPFPKSLVSVPHLTRLCYGCNPHFGDGLPPPLLNRSNFTTDFGICDDQGSSHSSKKTIIGGVVGGSLLFAIAVGVIFLCVFRRRLLTRRKLFDNDHTITKNAIFSVPSMDDLGFKSISIQAFTLESIEIATNKYKALIGEGGFGSVYRGTLPDGQEVAVKVRSATSSQGTREFENELNLLSAMRNDNLVPLLGYCCEFDQQILVYPFMSNGSLQDRLYGEASKRKVLDWPTRLSIALGAARGLLYLHTFAGRCIIHRDVKSSNILLDQSMTAKVADFGFSKYAPQEGDSGASLEVRGTAGYLDPEYYSTQHLSVKSDVFSFGVVLLEIISGREPLNIHRPRSEWSLVEWAKPFIRESRIDEIVDPSIKAGYHAEAMWRVVEVALACIEPFSAYRPCMVDIVRELEDALIIENNASEYMKSIDSFGGSNRFSIEKKVILPVIPAPTEPSPIISQALAPPQPR